MEWDLRLSSFYAKVRADNRISPVHISQYLALLHEASKSYIEYSFLERERIMEDAKIYSRVTYHRSIRQLHEYGYIEYQPSFIQGMSKVKMIEL
jgi:hypothetical protein